MRAKNLISIAVALCFFIHASAQTVAAWKISDLQDYIQHSDSPVIINFWATYCKPCLQEIPYFESMAKRYEKDGVKMLLVSLDTKEQYPKDIEAIILKRKFASKTVWLNETDADYFCPKVDSSWSGALPSTLLLNNKKGYRKFFEEQIPKEKLELEIETMIATKK